MTPAIRDCDRCFMCTTENRAIFTLASIGIVLGSFGIVYSQNTLPRIWGSVVVVSCVAACIARYICYKQNTSPELNPLNAQPDVYGAT